MDWAVEEDRMWWKFPLRWSFTNLCCLLKIDGMVYPCLLSVHSKWACSNQAYGCVLRIPEGKGREMCTLASGEVASRDNRRRPLAMETSPWSDFQKKKKEKFEIGRFLIVTLQVLMGDEDMANSNRTTFELEVHAAYRHFFGCWEERFVKRTRLGVVPDKIKTLLDALEHWRSNPEMGISIPDTRKQQTYFGSTCTLVQCMDVSDLVTRILEEGDKPFLQNSDYHLSGFTAQYVW